MYSLRTKHQTANFISSRLFFVEKDDILWTERETKSKTSFVTKSMSSLLTKTKNKPDEMELIVWYFIRNQYENKFNQIK